MKKIMIGLVGVLIACSTQAQMWTYNGHTYFKFGKASLSEAYQKAAQVNGHLLVVNNAQEYNFVNSNLIQKGDGWSWTGVSECDNMFKVDCAVDYGVLSEMNKHWNGTIGQTPVGPNAVVVVGKFQATYRSTLWVAKFYQWNDSFVSSQIANVIIECE